VQNSEKLGRQTEFWRSIITVTFDVRSVMPYYNRMMMMMMIRKKNEGDEIEI